MGKKLAGWAFWFFWCSLFLTAQQGFAQFNSNVTLEELVETITGEGVEVTNLEMNCADVARGVFDIGETSLGMEQGIVLSTGNGDVFNANNQEGFTRVNNTGGDEDLDNVSSFTTVDGCSIEFDIIPSCSVFEVRYVFGSEEYPEYVNGGFNDVFAFLVTGPRPTGGDYEKENIALVPGTDKLVSIDNINAEVNQQFYQANTGGQEIEYDGFTKPLVASVNVIPFETYHLKLAIADVGDRSFDSGVFIEMGGLLCNKTDLRIEAVNTEVIEGCRVGAFDLFRESEDLSSNLPVQLSYSGVAELGIDILAQQSIVFPAGEDSIRVLIEGIQDNLTEGDEGFMVRAELFLGTSLISADSTFMVVKDVFEVDLGADVVSCIGDSMVLDAGFFGEGTSFQWGQGTTNLGTAQTQFAKDVGEYWVEVKRSTCVDKDTIKVSRENLVPPQIRTLTEPVCMGVPVDLEAVLPNEIIEHHWGPEEWFEDDTLRRQQVTPTEGTTFFLAGQSKNGCVYVDSLKLDVRSGPQVEAGERLEICEGTEISLVASGGTRYLWEGQEGDPSPEKATFVNRALLSTFYVVKGFDERGCSAKDSVEVVVKPSPFAYAGEDTTVCPEMPFELLGEGNGTPKWLLHDGLTQAEGYEATGFVHKDTSFVFEVMGENGCATYDTILVKTHPLPELETVDSLFTCQGGTAQLNLQGEGKLFWLDDPTLSSSSIPDPVASPDSTRVYYGVAEDDRGCQNVDTVTVFVLPMGEAKVSVFAPKQCLGDSVVLSAVSEFGGNAPEFEWFIKKTVDSPFTPLGPASVENQVIKVPDLLGSEEVYVKMKSDYPCLIGDEEVVSITDTVELLPYPQVAIPDTAIICNSFPAFLVADDTSMAQADSLYQYQWFHSIDSSGFTEFERYRDSVHAYPTDTGYYYVEMTNEAGCSSTSEVVYVPSDTIFLDGFVSDDDIFYGDEVTLWTEQYNAVSVMWMGQGEANTKMLPGAQVRDSPEEETFYMVLGTSPKGCRLMDTMTVTVRDLVTVPNGFSPNGDGMNDFWIVEHLEDYPEAEVTIVNRWGAQVYQCNGGCVEPWDGMRNNTLLPVGTYYYVIDLKVDGRLRSGFVSIVR